MFKEHLREKWRGGRIGFGEAHARDPHPFWPDEARPLSRATPARQAEFAAGRAAARAALRAIGLLPYEIPMGQDRAPIWPKGVVGSITHNDGHCVAVAARSSGMTGVGVDLEAGEGLQKELLSEVLTAPEIEWLIKQPGNQRGELAKVIFSAKEATYKALYGVSRRVVGFDAMRIDLDLENEIFIAQLNTRFGPFGSGEKLRGQVSCLSGHILTFVAVPKRADCGENGALVPDLETECFQRNVG